MDHLETKQLPLLGMGPNLVDLEELLASGESGLMLLTEVLSTTPGYQIE